MLIVGFGLYSRATWAGVFAIVVAMLSAVSNFFFIPYYPIWALLLIGINVWIIWALTRPGADQDGLITAGQVESRAEEGKGSE